MPDLKEGWKDVGFTPGQQQESQKGAEASVEDRRPHLLETLDGDSLPVEALLAEEEHGDVGRVVQG